MAVTTEKGKENFTNVPGYGKIRVIGQRGGDRPQIRFDFGIEKTGPFKINEKDYNGSAEMYTKDSGEVAMRLTVYRGFNCFDDIKVPSGVERILEDCFTTAFKTLRDKPGYLESVEAIRVAEIIRTRTEDLDEAKQSVVSIESELKGLIANNPKAHAIFIKNMEKIKAEAEKNKTPLQVLDESVKHAS